MKPVYKKFSSLGGGRLQEDQDLTTFDLSDPGSWPVTEKMTDQQRSFLSSQAVLLAGEQPEIVDLRYKERDGRHLTSSMWYKTLENDEKIKRSWLLCSKIKMHFLVHPA